MKELQTVLNNILIDKNTNLKPENLKKNVTCLGVKGTYEGGIMTPTNYMTALSTADTIAGISTNITYLSDLSTSGTQYFNTDIVLGSDKYIKFKINHLNTNYGIFLGSNAESGSNMFWFTHNGGTTEQIRWDCPRANGVSGNMTNNEDHTIIINSSNIIVDNTTMSHSVGSLNEPLRFFAGSGYAGTHLGNWKFYWAEIYDKNTDNMLHKLVPVLENNVVKVYDLVTDKFYTNSGSGNFIAGSPIDVDYTGQEILGKLNNMLSDKNTNLISSNIRKDVTAFGVTGTYEGSGGSGDVKLFETVEEMNSSTGNTEGDLALVYKNEHQNMTADMKVTAITFPETVTLPTAFTDSAYGPLSPVDSSVIFDGNCDLSKTSFSFNSWFESGYIRASYTSEDGITYTRTSLQGNSGDLDNPVALPTAVKGNANIWNDNFGYFMQIGASVFEGIYIYKNNSWKLAPTQLDAISDYVYKQLFYGKNGIESGALGIPDNSFADTNAEVYNEIQNQYDNMEPRILTNDDKTIDKNIYFIPVKRDGTPLLDTSKVTDMSNMFDGCRNLTAIPLLDTSNVTNMTHIFNGCKNLTTIPQLDTSKVTDMTYMFVDCSSLTTIPLLDTSKVTNMVNMFNYCRNLATIPLLDTSNVTGMGGMFNGCKNLTTIPQLDTSKVTHTNYMFYNCSNLTTIPKLDTSKVTNMNQMFDGCTNLTTIPELNTSKVTNMASMFRGCTNLSDDSLNIIMQMCINATSYTDTKTLKYIGLTSEQADKCKTLSNYSAFTSAGWTTGY